ncbi:hypothetical protein HU200_062189 [Digitaria exilis]|uniref:Histone-lysine N-methyltransferase SUVR4 n=1 Tax=Digitaria exilis TaxID=1010633 RepID=A0A835DYY7_9POAL|nr:hypothetical protein HU200_062189 [Digitaria exilis]
MGGSNTDRARKAVDAMKLLGFSRKQSVPVLKKLLSIFNDNWEPIEDECYRTLADAILDAQDNNQAPASQQGTQAAHVDLESHGTTRDASADEEDNETPLVKRPRMGAAQFGQQLQPGPRQCSVSTQGALPASPQTSRRQTRSLTANYGDPSAIGDALILKEPKPDPDVKASQGKACQAVPKAIHLNAGSSGTLGLSCISAKSAFCTCVQISGAGVRRSTVNQPQNLDSSLQAVPLGNNGVGSTVENTKEASFVEVDVASSTNGEVKMTLKCNLDSSELSYSMEEVLKMVEEKCFHSYKMLPPDFSIGKLMTEVCESVAQLGAIHSDAHSNGSSLHKEAVAPFVTPIACEAGMGINDNTAGGSSLLESSEPCLQNLIVAWDPELARCKQRTTHDVTDISKGEERIRISVVNEFGRETCPPSFFYISRNIVFQDAYVNISIARIGDEDCCADCSGNCLSASLPCACARTTGGDFVYTPEGLVKTKFLDECRSANLFPGQHHRFYCKSCPLERSKNKASPDPCKGHLVRKFIKECWSKCGCGMQCGNRVIQRGITCKLQVFFTSEGKGWGLRTLEDLPKGAFVCEYAGEVLTNTELYARAIENARNGKHMHQVLLDADWGSEGELRDEEALGLDGTFYGNVGRFINHRFGHFLLYISCHSFCILSWLSANAFLVTNLCYMTRCYDANLVQIPVEVETPDHHYYHLAFFTTKKVEPFEELTWDYGIDFGDVDGPSKTFRCMCGSRYCRDPRSPST